MKFTLSPCYLLSTSNKMTLITKDWADLQKPPKFRASVSPKDAIIISPVHMVDFQFCQGRLSCGNSSSSCGADTC